jgi:hypothetical protein
MAMLFVGNAQVDDFNLTHFTWPSWIVCYHGQAKNIERKRALKHLWQSASSRDISSFTGR